MKDDDPVTERICMARMSAIENRISAIEKNLSDKIDSIKWLIVTSFSICTTIISLVIWFLR